MRHPLPGIEKSRKDRNKCPTPAEFVTLGALPTDNDFVIAMDERRKVNIERVVGALTEIADELDERRDSLTPLEWRTYAWARSSLAVLAGIRIEEALAELDPSEFPVTP